MSAARPHGAKFEARYSFSKVFVHDLDAMGAFYEKVFGLIPINRHQDVMFGRNIDEISFQPTYAGGSSLTLIKYLDSAAPTAGESVQGFTTTDIQAVISRAEEAGGTIPEPVRCVESFGISVVFVLDPEGHINEVVQFGVR